MSDLVSLKRKIDGAGQLKFVVRTMKAIAASKISQYEQAVAALADYERVVQMSLSVCFRETHLVGANKSAKSTRETIIAIVFGSDQGLVGQFNDLVAAHCRDIFANLEGEKIVWVIGERMNGRFAEDRMPPSEQFSLPASIDGITRLIGNIQAKMEEARKKSNDSASFYLFHATPLAAAQYEPVSQKLLPLDRDWQRKVSKVPWPNKALPELFGPAESMFKAVLREYLFISLFKACADSLASENVCRLSAMQRAEKNIDSIMTDLSQKFHCIRQNSIDEELFDVISGFNAFNKKK